jgi:predicted RNA-binding protein YlxR (DUF448 family)
MRTCIGCRANLPASQMRRCTYDPETETIGWSGASPGSSGRGAWLCRPACFEQAVQRKRFARAWRRPIPDGALESARIALADAFESIPENMRQWSSAGRDPGASISTKG